MPSAVGCSGSSSAAPVVDAPEDAGGSSDGGARTEDAAAPDEDANVTDASDAASSRDSAAVVVQSAALATGGFNEYSVGPDQSVRHWGAPFDVLSPVVRSAHADVGLKNVVAVAPGQMHALALLSSGEVRAWGVGEYFGLGDGNADPHRTVTIPVTVKLPSPATFVAASAEHSCAILASGEVRCWGMQLPPVLHQTATPEAVPLPNRATALAVADGHCCALLSTGEIACWGQNTHGQIGDGTTTDPPAPVVVKGVSTARMVSARGDHTCAVLASGAVQCWGSNANGELGNGSASTGDSPLAANVKGITNAVAVAAGGDHTCALLATGAVQCWGSNEDGQLGTAWDHGATSILENVPGITDARAINAGDRHSCAMLSNGDVLCWGDNQYGELGNGSPTPAYTNMPTKVIW